MPNYRRATVPGGTWVFTINLLERRNSDLLVREFDLLRYYIALERSRRPFAALAQVVLLDHMLSVPALASACLQHVELSRSRSLA